MGKRIVLSAGEGDFCPRDPLFNPGIAPLRFAESRDMWQCTAVQSSREKISVGGGLSPLLLREIPVYCRHVWSLDPSGPPTTDLPSLQIDCEIMMRSCDLDALWFDPLGVIKAHDIAVLCQQCR